ncbi:hypothetical protein MSS93_08940 [Deinococcus radiodurans]|nr:hypothetical protein MSS93_08940 [Deinococcus radiodurans]
MLGSAPRRPACPPSRSRFPHPTCPHRHPSRSPRPSRRPHPGPAVHTTGDAARHDPSARYGGSACCGHHPRQVNLNYTFPAELPAGIYSITVQDASGEREIMPGVPAGQVASRRAQAPIQVQGNAVFIIRRDGGEYARVPVQ